MSMLAEPPLDILAQMRAQYTPGGGDAAHYLVGVLGVVVGLHGRHALMVGAVAAALAGEVRLVLDVVDYLVDEEGD